MLVPTIGPWNPAPLQPLKFSADPIGYLCDIHRQYGRIAVVADGQSKLFMAFGPEYNQQVLNRPDVFAANLITVPGPKKSALRRVGLGLITMNGERHKQHRRLLMPTFQRKSIDRYGREIVTTTEEMLKGWAAGQVRDIACDMESLLRHIVCKTLFGLDDREAADKLGQTWNEVLAANLSTGLGFLPLEGRAAAYQEALASAERFEAQLLAMIERKRAACRQGDDVLSSLVRIHESDGSRLTQDELIGQTGMLFNAARQTTATALTWTLFLLAQHPSVLANLVHELERTLHGEAPTQAQLGQLSLLERVIKESMRVLPPVAFNTRTTCEAVDLGPHRLPKGSQVVFSHYVTHHMPEIFPEPERFLPERWLTAAPSPYAYLPFSAGPRMCIGAGMAMMTMKMVLAMILPRYRLDPVPYAEINRMFLVTLMPEKGMPMRISAQDGRFQSTPVRGNIHEMVTLDWAPERHARLAA